MYLLDTNIFLELLLEQEKAEEVRALLLELHPERWYISEFSLYSIGIVLLRLKKQELFLKFINDISLESEINSVILSPKDMERLVTVAERFNMDFDDAYQYVAAEKYDLTIISFDSDFDLTERKRKTPIEILKG